MNEGRPASQNAVHHHCRWYTSTQRTATGIGPRSTTGENGFSHRVKTSSPIVYGLPQDPLFAQVARVMEIVTTIHPGNPHLK